MKQKQLRKHLATAVLVVVLTFALISYLIVPFL